MNDVNYDRPMPLYQLGENCRFCCQEAVFHITAVEKGMVETMHLCLEHAKKNPHLEGVFLPVPCPKCAGRMENDCGANLFALSCRRCGFKTDRRLPL